MNERALAVALAVTAAHLMLETGTLAVGGSLVQSDFDRGPTASGAAGRALLRVHEGLALPLRPLAREGAPWSWARGYGGLVLNSVAWGVCGGLWSAARAATRRPRPVRP